MWSAGSRYRRTKPLDVYIGTRAVAICRGEDRLFAEPVVSLELGFEQLEQWLANSPAKQRLKIWLSGGLCRAFRVPAVPGVREKAELLRIAHSLVSSQVGLEGDCSVWMSKGGAAEPQVCVAVQTATIDRAVQMALAAGKHRVWSIKPWWTEVMKSVSLQNAEATVAVAHDCDSLTVVTSQGASLVLATTLSPVWDRASADAALARLRLSEDIPLEAQSILRLVVQRADAADARTGMALAPLVETSL